MSHETVEKFLTEEPTKEEKQKQKKKDDEKTSSSSKVSFSSQDLIYEENQNDTLDSTFLDSSLQRRRSSRLFSLNRRGLVQVEFYSGNSSAREWISRFKAGAAAEELSPEGQLELFATLLTGKAAIWWNAFGTSLESIDDALNGLAKAFLQPEKRNLLLELPNKRQYNKSVEDYGWEMVKLCKKVSATMPEHEIIDWFILGLNYKIRNKLIHEEFNTFVQALNAAKQLEDGYQKSFKKFSFKHSAQNNNNTQTQHQKPSSFSNNKSNIRSVNVIDKQRKCYNCGKPGHLQKNCSLPKQYSKKVN